MDRHAARAARDDGVGVAGRALLPYLTPEVPGGRVWTVKASALTSKPRLEAAC